MIEYRQVLAVDAKTIPDEIYDKLLELIDENSWDEYSNIPLNWFEEREIPGLYEIIRTDINPLADINSIELVWY